MYDELITKTRSILHEKTDIVDDGPDEVVVNGCCVDEDFGVEDADD